MKAAIHCLLVLIFWIPLTASATDVYKWTDANGVPSYGERPPEGVEYIKVKIYGASSGTRTGSYYATPSTEKKPAANIGKAEAGKSAAKKTNP